MKNKVTVLLFIVLLCALIASVVVNIITLRKCDRSRIMNVYDIGLGDLLNSEVKEMYVDEGSNPDLKGEFYDDGVIEDVREVLLSGCFQQASEPVIDSAPGSGVHPYFRFQTENVVYSLGIKGNVLSVTIDGEKQFYYTNVRHRIGKIINDAVKKMEP